MSLLTDPAPSAEQLAAKQIRQSIRAATLEAVAQIKQIHTQIWLMDGLDPQDVFDQFTTLGGSMLDARDALKDMVSAVADANGQDIDDYIDSAYYNPPAGKSLTVNMDGSVTVNDI